MPSIQRSRQQRQVLNLVNTLKHNINMFSFRLQLRIPRIEHLFYLIAWHPTVFHLRSLRLQMKRKNGLVLLFEQRRHGRLRALVVYSFEFCIGSKISLNGDL